MRKIISNDTRKKFDKVLKKQFLYDLPAIFKDTADYYCVPLYSRYKNVFFLKKTGDVNEQLISLSIEYLKRINDYLADNPIIHKDKGEMVAIINIDCSYPEDDYYVPYLIVANKESLLHNPFYNPEKYVIVTNEFQIDQFIDMSDYLIIRDVHVNNDFRMDETSGNLIETPVSENVLYILKKDCLIQQEEKIG